LTDERPLVLVADDDEDIVALVSAVLSRAGFDIVQASDGAQALELVRTQRVRLAVLDVSMPELDGMEVLRFVRADPQTADLPVILLSARAQETDVRVGYAEGASKYVRKPFSPRELVVIVRELVA
jgi:two-component system response regulator MtrA